MLFSTSNKSPKSRIRYYLIRAAVISVVALAFYLVNPVFKVLLLAPLIDLLRAAVIYSAQKYMQSKQG